MSIKVTVIPRKGGFAAIYGVFDAVESPMSWLIWTPGWSCQIAKSEHIVLEGEHPKVVGAVCARRNAENALMTPWWEAQERAHSKADSAWYRAYERRHPKPILTPVEDMIAAARQEEAVNP